MKLDPQQQVLLLELATTQRLHESSGKAPESPEQAELTKATNTLARQHSATHAAQRAVDDMEREILRIQADEARLRSRIADNKKQLMAATDPSTRKDLNKDLYTTKSRLNDLLSELAEAHNEIHALRNNLDLANQRLADAEQAFDVAQAAKDAAPAAPTAADREHRMAEIRQSLPADVVAAYDAQRNENSVGVAAFNGRSCGGCFIILPAGDIAAIRGAAADELPQCPDCGSYLVRT